MTRRIDQDRIQKYWSFSAYGTKKDRFDDIKNAIYVLFIANTTIWIGNIIQTINTGESVLTPSIIDFDLGLLLIYLSLFVLVEDTIMLMFAILGWIFAGIWARRNVGQNYATVVILSIFIPLSLPIILVAIVLFNFALGSLEFLAFLQFLPIIIFLLIFLSASGLIVALPSILIGGLISPKGKMKSLRQVNPYFLVLAENSVLTTEPVNYCPFRMKDKPGCSFLGYEAPDAKLICDYQSQWLTCFIYSHLFYKLEVIS